MLHHLPSIKFVGLGLGALFLAAAAVTTKIEIGTNLATVLVAGLNIATGVLNAVALRKRANGALDAKQFPGQKPRKASAIQRRKPTKQ